MTTIPFHPEVFNEPALISLSGSDLDDQPESDADYADRGLVRAHGLIDIALNDRLKALARKRKCRADQFIGELITRFASELDRLEAEQEAARLRERFGDQWLELLKQTIQ